MDSIRYLNGVEGAKRKSLHTVNQKQEETITLIYGLPFEVASHLKGRPRA